MTQPHGNRNPEAEFKTPVKITRKFRFLDQGRFKTGFCFLGFSGLNNGTLKGDQGMQFSN